MKKLRLVLLALVGVVLMSFVTGCSPKIQGKYVGDNRSWYSTMNIKNGKGTELSISDNKYNEKHSNSVEIKGDKISFNGEEQSYTLDKDGNITIHDGLTFYKADSDKGKELINRHREVQSQLKTDSYFGIGTD